MKFMQDKCTNLIKEKVLFQELSSSYGEKYNRIKANFLSKLHTQKFIINKSKIFWIFNLAYFIVDGILRMDFLLKIWSL